MKGATVIVIGILPIFLLSCAYPNTTRQKQRSERDLLQGWEYADKGTLDEAIAAWEKAATIDPDNGETHEVPSVFRLPR